MHTLPDNLPAFFWHFLKAQWGRFLILSITMLGWSIEEAAYPYFTRLVVDHLTLHAAQKSTIFTSLSLILFAWAGLWLMIELGYRVYDFLSASTFPRFEANIRSAIFEHSLKHSYQYFSNNLAGSISSKISRMTTAMQNVVTHIVSIFLPVVFAFLMSIYMLFQAQPIFGYIVAAWVTLHFSATYYFTQHCAKLSSSHSESLNTLNGKIIDVLTNIATTRLFARNRFELSYYSRFQNEEISRAYNLYHYNAIMKTVLGLTSQLFAFTMVGFGIYAWREDWITLGELTQALASLHLIGLAWYMGMHLISIYEDIGTCRDSLTLIREPHGIIDIKNAKPLKVNQGKIVFDNVTFHYNPNRNLFKEKTVTLRAGEKIGLVGFSGSGKTTFVNLILRHFDVEKGRILIDEQDIKKVTQESCVNKLLLFHRTPVYFIAVYSKIFVMEN
jgi:ATP-binding cassette subfamily B protein